MYFKQVHCIEPFYSSGKVNGRPLQRPHNDSTITKYSRNAAKFLYMTLRYTQLSPSEDTPLKITFLPSQLQAAKALHTLLDRRRYSAVDKPESKQLIHALLSSLFFPHDSSHEIDAQGPHSPVNCFFLAISLQDNVTFKPPQSLTPRINEISFILRLVACQQLALNDSE